MEKDILLCYIVDMFRKRHIDKETFLPAAAKLENGKITDFMYDSFIFLPQPNYLYDYLPTGARIKSLKKEDILSYIIDEQFAPGMNIDALDAAVGEAKKALGRPDYKANVFMTLLYPESSVTEFGTVDGRNLNFSLLEDRKAALKWMADESLKQFDSRNYKNIRAAGFYWFYEDMSFKDNNREMVGYISDYVRSRGCKTCWCPYFGALGHDIWKEIGFDIAAHQANFFPEHHKDWPNRGTEERLPMVAEITKKTGIGVGMEMSDSRHESACVFKQYLKAGAHYGFMHYPHIYYIGSGPKTVREIYESDDPYVRSVYGELHKFINRTLNPDEVYTED